MRDLGNDIPHPARHHPCLPPSTDLLSQPGLRKPASDRTDPGLWPVCPFDWQKIRNQNITLRIAASYHDLACRTILAFGTKHPYLTQLTQYG